MPKTIAQIRDRAAYILGILPIGQELEDQDKLRIDEAYLEVFNYLKTKGFATWPFSGEVPDDVSPWVIVRVAHNCLNDYGVSNDRYTRIVSDFNVSEQNIRELTNIDNPKADDSTDY